MCAVELVSNLTFFSLCDDPDHFSRMIRRLLFKLITELQTEKPPLVL